VVSPNIRSGSITSVGSAAISQKHTGGSGQDTTIVLKPMAIIPNPITIILKPTTIILKPMAVILNPMQDAGSDDTDIVFIPGMKQIALTNQHPLLRAVIQEAFENLWASLLFNHGFLTANVTPSLIRISLITAAQTLSPKALQIYLHFMNDHEYMEKTICLVSFCNIEIMSLTNFSAVCSYSPLPRGDQRLLQCDYTCFVLSRRIYPVS